MSINHDVIGVHGPAPIGVHCSRLNPLSVIFAHTWQVEEARLLPGYIVPQDFGVGVVEITASSFQEATNPVVFIVSSGYWLREKMDMLFAHEKLGYGRIERMILERAEDIRFLYGAREVVVLPHPRELKYPALTEEFYRQFCVSVSKKTMDEMQAEIFMSIMTIGGISTSFGRFGTHFTDRERMQIVVPDSWLYREVFSTSFGKLFVSETKFLQNFVS